MYVGTTQDDVGRGKLLLVSSYGLSANWQLLP